MSLTSKMCWHCDGRRTDPVSGDWCLHCRGTGVVEEDDGADEDDEPDEELL